MEYELNYIVKVNSYADKVKVINHLVETQDYHNALKAVRALIEATGIVVLAKKYNSKPKNSQLSWIADSLLDNGDEYLSDWFKNVNGSLEYIYENKEINEERVIDILLELDELIGIVLKKYNGILS